MTMLSSAYGCRWKGKGVLLLAVLLCFFLSDTACILPKPAESKVAGIIGDWAYNATKLNELAMFFEDAHPFPHVVLDNFFSPETADRIEHRFPAPNGTWAEWLKQGWHIYDNPIEGKLAHDNFEIMESHDVIFSDMWGALQSDEFIRIIETLSRIKGLEKDPYLHGGGLHFHPPGSRLEMHLDYSIHPISKKERRLNLIIYMNRDWKEEWGGHLALWEGSLEGLRASSLDGLSWGSGEGEEEEGLGGGVGKKGGQDRRRNERGGARIVRAGAAAEIAPIFNRAVLFRTSDISWHGMPDAVSCPEGQARKSVAIYYMSDARPHASPRFKAAYRPRPGSLHPQDEDGYNNLCKIREERRLENDDVVLHLPSWKPRWKLV